MAKMYFHAQELKNALAKISAAVGAGKINPAEKSIYIRGGEGVVTFQAQNGYVTAQVACPTIDGATPTFYDFAVEGKKLTAFVSKLGGDRVAFDVSGKKLGITTSQAEISLPIRPDRISPIDGSAFSLVAEIKNKELKAAVQKAIVCTSKSETRPIMTAINFAQKFGVFELQACDGTRLSVVKLADGSENNFSYLIPAEAISAILSMASSLKDDDPIRFKQANGRSAIFEFADVVVHAKFITDDYLDIHALIPNNYDKKITVDMDELKSALEIVLLATFDGRTPLKISLNSAEMKISTSSTEANCAVTIPLAYSNITEDFVIGFSPSILCPVVKSFAAEEVVISFGTKTQGALIETEGHTALVLPVRLRE